MMLKNISRLNFLHTWGATYFTISTAYRLLIKTLTGGRKETKLVFTAQSTMMAVSGNVKRTENKYIKFLKPKNRTMHFVEDAFCADERKNHTSCNVTK